MKFSEKLIKLRKSNGLSQEEFGNKINVSRQAVSKWESEQSSPEIDKIKEISKVFNVSTDYLLNDDIDEFQKTIKKPKNFKKIILIVFLIVLSVYLLTVIYKFTVLLIFKIKADKIANYSKFSISSDMNGEGPDNINFSSFNDCVCENNIEVTELYNNDSTNPESITYINYNNNKAYTLTYNPEINKYLYDNYEIPNEPTTIKGITKWYTPSTIGQILLLSINPKVTVTFKDEFLYITSKPSKEQKEEISINKKTGILDQLTYMSNNDVISNIKFDYTFDDDRFDNTYLINEEFLEDIEFIYNEDLN